MKTGILTLFAIVALFTGSLLAGQTFDYAYTITSTTGEMIGGGVIYSPVKLNQDGKTIGSWTFRARNSPNVTGDGLRVKRRLSTGRGNVEIRKANGRLTLNFHPDIADDNVVVMWATDKETAGQVFYADAGGGRVAGVFKLEKAGQQNGAGNGGSAPATTQPDGPAAPGL